MRKDSLDLIVSLMCIKGIRAKISCSQLNYITQITSFGLLQHHIIVIVASLMRQLQCLNLINRNRNLHFIKSTKV